MKKKIFLPLVCILSFALLTRAQDSSTDMPLDTLKQIVDGIFFDQELMIPYPTTENHSYFKEKGMKSIVNKKYEEILKICSAKGFTSFMILDAKSRNIYTTTSASEITQYLREFKGSLPTGIKTKPDKIQEYEILGDFIRVESWDFINKYGKKSNLYVQFVNGQITNFRIEF